MCLCIWEGGFVCRTHSFDQALASKIAKKVKGDRKKLNVWKHFQYFDSWMERKSSKLNMNQNEDFANINTLISWHSNEYEVRNRKRHCGECLKFVEKKARDIGSKVDGTYSRLLEFIFFYFSLKIKQEKKQPDDQW